jgi:hypothetical protein
MMSTSLVGLEIPSILLENDAVATVLEQVQTTIVDTLPYPVESIPPESVLAVVLAGPLFTILQPFLKPRGKKPSQPTFSEPKPLPPNDAHPRGLYPPNHNPPAFANKTAAPSPSTLL